MNIWVRTGKIGDDRCGHCTLRRLDDHAKQSAMAQPLIDTTSDDPVSALERLAGISPNRDGFSLAGNDPSIILAAAAMGAQDIIVDDANLLDLAALNRIVEARRSANGSVAEARERHPGEQYDCLTVRRAMAPGMVIAETDIETASTSYSGLGPGMKSHLIGLRLRYPVAPGDALHFAHFHDRYAAEY